MLGWIMNFDFAAGIQDDPEFMVDLSDDMKFAVNQSDDNLEPLDLKFAANQSDAPDGTTISSEVS